MGAALGVAMLTVALAGDISVGLEPSEDADELIERDVSVAGVPTGAYEAFVEERAAKSGVAALGEGGGDSSGVGDGGLSVGDWRGVVFDPIGVPVGVDGPDGLCVVTDLVDPVAGLVPCDDLVRPVEGEDGGEDGQESGGDEAGPVIITVTRSDFAELPLALPVVHLQPEREWFLVNMELLVFTDGDEQVLDTTVLGVPVRVRARPVEFSWDFGDGSEPVVTTGPGAPWPATDVGHVYTSEARGVVVTLTTTWSGEFQVAGQGPWIPIAGTTSTQSQSAPFRLESIQTRLTAHH